MVVGDGFEPSKSATADLQSAPFGRSGTPPQHNLERVKGIEPSRSAWKAEVLPLNYTRKSFSCVMRKYIPGFHFFKPVFHFFSFFPGLPQKMTRSSARKNRRRQHPASEMPPAQIRGKSYDGTGREVRRGAAGRMPDAFSVPFGKKT